MLDTGRLQISGLFLDDSGMYSCIATNSSGQTSWKAYLRVIGEGKNQTTPGTKLSKSELTFRS